MSEKLIEMSDDKIKTLSMDELLAKMDAAKRLVDVATLELRTAGACVSRVSLEPRVRDGMERVLDRYGALAENLLSTAYERAQRLAYEPRKAPRFPWSATHELLTEVLEDDARHLRRMVDELTEQLRAVR